MRTKLGQVVIDPVTGIGKLVRGEAHPPKPMEVPAPAFDSKLEAERAEFLFGLQLAGDVLGYLHHPPSVAITNEKKYTPDFLVLWKGGRWAYEEVKGSTKQKNCRDSETRLSIAAMKWPHLEWYFVTRRRDGLWTMRRFR